MSHQRKLNINKLEKELNSLIVNKSLDYLLKRISDYVDYNNLEDCVSCVETESKTWESFEINFIKVRNEIYYCFYRRGIFISQTAIDEILFYHLKRTTKKALIKDLLITIKNLGLHHKSIVIFPVHSFGMFFLGWKTLLFDNHSSCRFIMPNNEFAIFPQTNSIDKTYEQIKQCLKLFRVSYKKEDLLNSMRHYRITRCVGWLEQNPLAVATFNFSKRRPYENQFFIAQHIEKNSSVLHFIASEQLTKSNPTNKAVLFSSTRAINNWQTLDIKHYLTLHVNKHNKKLVTEIVPININEVLLRELMSINIEIHPSFRLDKNRVKKWVDTMDYIFKEYNEGRWKENKDRTKKQKFMTKIVFSLEFYRKSFYSPSMEEKIVNLATAFESILLDYYGAKSGGTDKTLSKRVESVFYRKRGKQKYSEAVQQLYKIRCKIVHNGFKVDDFNELSLCQLAYVRCFEALFKKKNTLNFKKEQPIRSYFESRGVLN